MTIAELTGKSLYWQQHAVLRYHYCYYDGELLLLRMNDFPDEPLFTVINKLEIIDLEELPSSWVIEFR